jgi:hypothetical protein
MATTAPRAWRGFAPRGARVRLASMDGLVGVAAEHRRNVGGVEQTRRGRARASGCIALVQPLGFS